MELQRFARVTKGHETVDADRIAGLEPELAGRFGAGLYYGSEGHMAPLESMQFVLDEIRKAGGDVRFGTTWIDVDESSDTDIVIDCRGLMAQEALPDLRGVRGERVLLRTSEVNLSRPVRLLHPRQPLYVVPWGDGIYMVGATVIESGDQGTRDGKVRPGTAGAGLCFKPSLWRGRNFGTRCRRTPFVSR